MGKFIPAELIEPIEYDFTQYGGSEGVIAEPTTKQVQDFFRNMKDLIKEVSKEIKGAQRLEALDPEDMDADVLAAQMDAIDEKSDQTEKYQRRTVEHLAVLCGAKWTGPDDEEPTLTGGSPSFKDLEALPYRVLQTFSQWLVKEIQPKDNPRYGTLTGGQAQTYYLARRYFGMSVQEWDELPWWQSVMYIEGLREQKILGGGENATSSGQAGPGISKKKIDYAEDPFLPNGFKTRRAG